MIRSLELNCPYCKGCNVSLLHDEQIEPSLVFNADGNGRPCQHLVFIVGSFYHDDSNRTDLEWNHPAFQDELEKVPSEAALASVWDAQVEMCVGGSDHKGQRGDVEYTLCTEHGKSLYRDVSEYDPEKQDTIGMQSAGAVFSPDAQQFALKFIAEELANV